MTDHTDRIIYLIGFLVGVLVVFIVGTIIRNVTKKKNGQKCEYDERQVLARGMAYSSAFFTLVIYMFTCALLDVAEIKWAETSVQMFLGAFLSIAVFVIISIVKDAYFTLANKRKNYIIIFAIVIAINLWAGIANIIESGIITNEMLNTNVINISIAVMFSAIFAVLVGKCIADRKTVEE